MIKHISKFFNWSSTYRFYKDELGWFIDLKWFPLDRSHLAMVAGADTLLEELSQGKSEVKLKISTFQPWDYDTLSDKNGCLDIITGVDLPLFSGRFYKGRYKDLAPCSSLGNAKMLWLCAVTLFVFGRYPDEIYYKIV